MKIKRALLSVSDKTGIVELAKFLSENGVEIISTGGTMKAIKDAGIPVTYVSDVTGFPEIMDGRVKTLNPKIHGAILAVRSNPEHMKALAEHDITPIDLVVVNLYPFRETVAKPGVTEEEAIAYFRKVGTEHELQKIKDILKEFRVSFDVWFSETSLYEGNKIEPAINKLKEKGYTYEQDGALWFRTTDFGDDKDRVLIKTDGSYTYFTPDIAYHLSKMNRGYDYLVDLLGADHHGYINRMKAAIQALGYNADQLNIDILQMVRMVENGEVVKMSKRTGNAVTIRDLIDDIGVDATRYFFVAKAANTPFDFDLGLAKSQSNENPVYYAQYAHARMCSIMRSAAEKNIEPADHFELINNPKEIELLKHINEFKNTINDAARTRAPHKIANYIQKLAQLFHSFYGDCHVIDEENKELSSQRLALVEATRITLANALNLIGVHAPEKM